MALLAEFNSGSRNRKPQCFRQAIPQQFIKTMIFILAANNAERATTEHKLNRLIFMVMIQFSTTFTRTKMNLESLESLCIRQDNAILRIVMRHIECTILVVTSPFYEFIPTHSNSLVTIFKEHRAFRLCRFSRFGRFSTFGFFTVSRFSYVFISGLILAESALEAISYQIPPYLNLVHSLLVANAESKCYHQYYD